MHRWSGCRRWLVMSVLDMLPHTWQFSRSSIRGTLTLNERLTSVSETQDPVALLERLLDIRPNFLNVAGVVKSDNCALVRSPINILPVGRIQGYCYCLDLDKIFLGFGDGSIGDHLCLPCTLNNKCFLHGHWVRRQVIARSRLYSVI